MMGLVRRAVGDRVEGVIGLPSACKSSVRPNALVRQSECSAAVAVSIVLGNPEPSADALRRRRVIYRIAATTRSNKPTRGTSMTLWNGPADVKAETPGDPSRRRFGVS